MLDERLSTGSSSNVLSELEAVGLLTSLGKCTQVLKLSEETFIVPEQFGASVPLAVTKVVCIS